MSIVCKSFHLPSVPLEHLWSSSVKDEDEFEFWNWQLQPIGVLALKYRLGFLSKRLDEGKNLEKKQDF